MANKKKVFRYRQKITIECIKYCSQVLPLYLCIIDPYIMRLLHFFVLELIFPLFFSFFSKFPSGIWGMECEFQHPHFNLKCFFAHLNLLNGRIILIIYNMSEQFTRKHYSMRIWTVRNEFSLCHWLKEWKTWS